MSVTMRRNFVYQLNKCHYSTESAAKASLVGEYDIKSSVLKKNNIPLLSINEHLPYSRVTVAFRSGSRYEKGDNVGISNIIRSSTGLGTKQFTKFGITRNLDIAGVSLYASNDREIFSYTMEGLRENMGPLLVYLASVATSPDFKPWELKDNITRIKLEHSSISNEAKAVDLLHKAAYKIGLGNSLFTPEYKLSSFTQENLSEYYQETFTASRALVAGSGVDYNLLTEFGNFLELPNGNTIEPVTAKYYGGEERLGAVSAVTHIAVAGEAPGYTKKDAAAYGVLSYIYGSNGPLKYSSSKGIISEVVSKVTNEFSVGNLNISYPDSGLVGFLLSASSSKIDQVYPVALAEFLKGTVNDKDVAKAKAKLKADFLNGVEDSKGLINFLANQLGHSTVLTPNQVVAAIDAVTPADVKQAAKKVSSGNLAVSVVGQIDQVPYTATLK